MDVMSGYTGGNSAIIKHMARDNMPLGDYPFCLFMRFPGSSPHRTSGEVRAAKLYTIFCFNW